MVRSILAVIVSFIAMYVLVTVLFIALAFFLGAEGVFQPGTWKATSTVDFASLGLTLISAVAGGWLCALIARKRTPAMVLAGFVLVFGLIFAVMSLSKPDAGPRDPNLKPLEVMKEAQTKSKDTTWVAFCFPIIGAAGVLAGASLVKKKA